MTEPESEGFFSRICCCYANKVKQPQVELIRTGSLTPPPRNISAAKEAVDGFEEINLELRVPVTSQPVVSQAPPTSDVITKDDDEFVLNDLMMDELTGEHEHPVVEDVVSIGTNVVEEVDEEELKSFADKPSVSDMADDTKKPPINENEDEDVENDDEATSRSTEVVSFHQMIAEGYESPTETSRPQEEHVQEEDKNDIGRVSSRSVHSPDLRSDDVMATLSAREDVEDEEEEEIMIEVEPDFPSPPPPPAQMTSAMYAGDSTDDEESDEEEDREVLAVPVRSTTQQSETRLRLSVDSDIEGADEDEEEEKGRMIARIGRLEPSHREEEEEHGEVVVEKHERKESAGTASSDLIDLETPRPRSDSGKENACVTRVSVKSNGTATVTAGAVRVALDSRDLTDDEFSEKLI